MEPQTGTVIAGIGNEVLLSVGIVVGVFLVMVTLFGNGQQLYRATLTVPAVIQEPGQEPEVAQLSVENCSVCLDRILNPVQTNCGHRFCAHCILDYWRHDQWPRPAHCPICRTTVTLLLVSDLDDEQLRSEILDYNQRHSGEWRPLLSYLSDIPIILRHLWSELFSERGPNLIRRLYLRYILVLLVLYLLSPFDLIPESVFGLLGYVDDLMIVLVVVVYISFLYRNVLTGRT